MAKNQWGSSPVLNLIAALAVIVLAGWKFIELLIQMVG